MDREFSGDLSTISNESSAGNIGREILPAVAMPNLLRGISQFKKSGALWYDLIVADNDQDHLLQKNVVGYLSFDEGLITGLGVPGQEFAKMFLERLNRGGYFPPNVYELLLESGLEVDALVKLLESESYLSPVRLHELYNAMIEDHIFEVLGSENGSIKFRSLLADNSDKMDSRVTVFISFFSQDNDGVAKGFLRRPQPLSPCQILLDYLEVDILRRDIAEGDVYLLSTASDAQRSLLSENEQNILFRSDVDISIESLINSLADSRRVILELVRKLHEEGALSLDTKCADPVEDFHAAHEDKPLVNENSVGDFNAISETSAALDLNIGIFERINTFLLSPEGIEWILWRMLIPFVLLASVFGMSGMQSFVGDLRLFISH